MSQKNLMAILVIAVIVLTGTTVYFATVGKDAKETSAAGAEKGAKQEDESKNQSQTQTQVQQTAPAVSEAQDATQSAPKSSKYNNETYGFELTLPETWKNGKATEHENENWTDICFSVINEGSMPFCIFQLVIYDESEWQKNLKTNPKLESDVISKTGGNIITCSGCCKEGDDVTGGGQFDEFQIQRCKEAPMILKTFKLSE